MPDGPSTSAGRVAARLAELKLEIPAPKRGVANYVPYVRTGGDVETELIFISGQIPKTDAGELTKGRFLSDELAEQAAKEQVAGSLESREGEAKGRHPTVAEGYAAAKLCGLNIAAQVTAALSEPGDARAGNLDFVKQIVKLEGFVNCEAGFTQHPQVLNGASDVLCEIFGKDVGSHARFAVGSSSLPMGVLVEIGALVELRKA